MGLPHSTTLARNSKLPIIMNIEYQAAIDMPLLRSLMKDVGAVVAIDMALLRSSSRGLAVPKPVSKASISFSVIGSIHV